MTTTRIEVSADGPGALIARAAAAGASDAEPPTDHQVDRASTIKEVSPIHSAIVGRWRSMAARPVLPISLLKR